MKVVVRKTPKYKVALEAFLKQHPNLVESHLGLSQLFQNEKNWGTPLGKGLYKSEIFMERITSYTPKKKDTVVTTRFAIEYKVCRTEKQTTVTLHTIA